MLFPVQNKSMEDVTMATSRNQYFVTKKLGSIAKKKSEIKKLEDEVKVLKAKILSGKAQKPKK